jgi:hypothetical protein
VIDLDDLATRLGLPTHTANALGSRAAVALERRHRPGVRLTGTLRAEVVDEELRWQAEGIPRAPYEDMNRVTEEGAEAIALALACGKCSWRIRRRLQSRLCEGADWLLTEPSSGRTMVLEVGGTDERDLATLLRVKLEQARRSPFSARGTPAACVVRFFDPSVIFWSDDGHA